MQQKGNQLRRLTAGLAGVALLIVTLFSLLGNYMNKKSEDTIEQVGKLYMTGMNEQITMHYETIIDFRFSQLSAIIATLPSETSNSNVRDDKLLSALEYHAAARGFEYLALCSADGSFEMIYGNAIKAMNPEPFNKSINRKEQKVAAGIDTEGNKIILFSVPCNYTMSDNRTGIALVAGISRDEMSKVLFLSTDSSLVSSYIIRKNGNFVLHNRDELDEDHVGGFAFIFDDQTDNIEQYINELTVAMENDEDYSAILKGANARRHIYCTSLSYSEWYLVTIMPYDALKEAVNTMALYGICGFLYCSTGIDINFLSIRQNLP